MLLVLVMGVRCAVWNGERSRGQVRPKEMSVPEALQRTARNSKANTHHQTSRCVPLVSQLAVVVVAVLGLKMKAHLVLHQLFTPKAASLIGGDFLGQQ